MKRLTVVLLVLLTVLIGAPAAALLFPWQASFDALAQPLNQQAALRSLALALGVLAVAWGIGGPLGFLFGRTHFTDRNALLLACTLPYIIPPYITAIAWIALLNPTNGLLNRPLLAAGLPPLNIYSLSGMIFVIGLETTPLVLLAVADGLRRMDASFEEQARMAGARPWKVATSVTLPLILPRLVSSGSLAVATATASFGVPYLLASGTTDPDVVLTTRIYQALDLTQGRPTALALSIALVGMGLLLGWVLQALLGRRRFTLVTGKATRQAPFPLGRLKALAWAFVGLYLGMGVGLPVVTLVLTSVMANFGQGLRLDNLTLQNYAHVVLGRPDTLPSLGRSLGLALVSAGLATAIGVAIAWNRVRNPDRWSRLVSTLAKLPYAVPGTVLALGLLLAWSQEIRLITPVATFVLALGSSIAMLGLAYTLKFLAIPVGNQETALEAIEPSLEEAARMSGASPWQSFRSITGPLLAPTIVTSAWLVFLPAFTEVTLSVLLAGPSHRVVGTLLFDLQTYGDPPAAAVLAVVVLSIALLGNGLLRTLTPHVGKR